MTTRHQINAIYREFPWLNQYAPKRHTSLATVSRMSKEFLEDRPRTISYSDPAAPYFLWGMVDQENIYLLDENGGKLAQVAAREEEPGWFWSRFPCWLWRCVRTFVGSPTSYSINETVGEALAHLGDKAKDVRYAVSEWHGTVSVYKPSKDAGALSDLV